MKDEKNEIFKMVLIVVLYSLLGLAGIYSNFGFILFPILAVPMTIWFMKSETSIKNNILMNTIIMIVIYFISGTIQDVFSYILSVILPAYTMGILYRRKMSVPAIIMYTTVAVSTGLLLYVVGMYYLGIDYIAIYMDVLEQYGKLQIQTLDTMAKGANQATIDQIDILKEYMSSMFTLFRYIYPAMLIILNIFFVIVQSGIVTIIGKIRKWELPSMKQLFYFRFSQASVLLLIVAMIMIKFIQDTNSPFLVVAYNLSLLFQYLFQIVGLITLIILIRRSTKPKGVKLLGMVLTITLFYTLPTMIMLVGSFETIVNYRKVEIVV